MQTVSLDHGQLAFVQQGTGLPVVLVHGFPFDHRMWQHPLATLAADAHVVVPDLRGFGSSSGLADPLTMSQLADDLAQLVAALEISQPICLVGLSMGGYIAFEFWRRHRKLLGGLVLCDTKAETDTPQALQNRHRMAEHVLAYGTELVAQAMLPNLVAAETVSQQPRVMELLRTMIVETGVETIAAAQRGMALRQDATSWLAEIDVPTLVVAGENDQLTPAAAMHAMAQSIPDAEFVSVPAAGHMAPLENPAVVTDAIRQHLVRRM